MPVKSLRFLLPGGGIMKLSRRSEEIKISGIRRVFELGATIKDPIDLSIGQPDFSIPEIAAIEGKKALDEGFTRYTLTQGIQPLRDKVNEYYKKTHGVSFEECFITCGVAGGIITSFFSVLEEGDEVLLPDPVFMIYEQWVRFLGGKVVRYDTYPDFKAYPDRVEKLITPKTKIMMIVSPSNPTGVVFEDSDVRKLANIAKKHNLLVISDEIYDRFCYDSEPTTVAKYYDNVLVMGGFSKFAGMPGMRLGYALGNKDLIMAMRKIQQFSFVCAPSVSQRIGVVVMDYDFGPTRDRYREKRDMLYNGLKDRFEITKPNGAFYAFPRVPWGDSTSFCETAIKHKVLIIPGSEFSLRNSHFRISFATSNDKLAKGIEILNYLADNPPEEFAGK